MNISFNGKRALVTGAGKGIGRAVAIALENGGAETIALSRTQADLDSLKAEVPGIQTVCCDIGDWDVTRKVVQSLGPIDLLVNNAGIALLLPAVDTTPESLDKTLNINVKAQINITQVVSKGMIERGKGGSIVNVSSQASVIGLKNHLSYCASKSALDSATRVFALELGPHQIRVNCVNPTVVLTDMGRIGWSDPVKAKGMLDRIPLGKFAEVKDVVHPILYLLSKQADMITGTCLPIDGGCLSS